MFLERRIQYRPSFANYCKGVGSILSQYNYFNAVSNDNIKATCSCRKLIVVLLQLLNNLLYEQANKKKKPRYNLVEIISFVSFCVSILLLNEAILLGPLILNP